MPDHEFNISPGMTISHFRLEKLLGEGGMGVVYLAEDITLGRKVAIKFMHKSMLANLPTEELKEQVAQRFIREAKSIAGVSHTNLCQVYEANFSTDNWYIVMEFINGRALDEILQEKGAFTEKEALRILNQTAQGLKFAWDKCKIVHRDIKPQNLMFTTDNFVKIVDLGLAKPVVDYEEDDYNLTNVGMPVGTPFYMSPEQAVAGIIDYRADMFSLGATFYELLTNTKTYMGKTIAMIYRMKLRQEYPKLKDLGFSENISIIIDRLLEPEAHNRYHSYEELIYDIRLARRGQKVIPNNQLPQSFDPMEDTLDEMNLWNNDTADSPSDPMQETIDDSSISDPMQETIDDSSISDPMQETIDDSSISDPMQETIDDSSISDPMQETIDDSKFTNEQTVDEEDSEVDLKKAGTPASSKSLKIQTLSPPVERDKNVRSLIIANSPTKEEKKKKSYAWVLLLFIIPALGFLGFSYFSKESESPLPENELAEFAENYKWQSSYYNQAENEKLKSFQDNDQSLKTLFNFSKNEDLQWLLGIYEKNHSFEGHQNLNVPETIKRIRASIEAQKEIDKAYKNLEIHKLIADTEKLLSDQKYTHSSLNITGPMTTAELLETYAKLKNAAEWIKQTKKNDALFKKLSESDFRNSAEYKTLSKELEESRKRINPYKDPLSEEKLYSLMTEFSNRKETASTDDKKTVTDTTSSPAKSFSVMKAPLKELEELLDQIATKYDKQTYASAAQKIQLMNELEKQASPEEKQKFLSLKNKHKELKKLEYQLSIEVKLQGERTSRQWPTMAITPDHPCYYVVLYEVNSSEAKIVEPSSPDDNKISAGQPFNSKPFPITAFNKKVFRTWVIGFTYLSDLKEFYKLQEIESTQTPKFKIFAIKDMNALLEKFDPMNYSKKLIELK